MKKFTSEEIKRARKYFLNQHYPTESIDVGNRLFSYFVLPQSLEPELHDFVFRCTGNPKDGHVFGISDSMPKKFRPYAVLHELIEFTEIGVDVSNRCVQALEKEIELVPENIRQEYLLRRKAFFKNLIGYCSQRPRQYTNDDIKEFSQSLTRLEKMLRIK